MSYEYLKGGCRKKDLQPTSGLDLDSATAAAAAAGTAPVRFGSLLISTEVGNLVH